MGSCRADHTTNPRAKQRIRGLCGCKTNLTFRPGVTFNRCQRILTKGRGADCRQPRRRACRSAMDAILPDHKPAVGTATVLRLGASSASASM